MLKAYAETVIRYAGLEGRSFSAEQLNRAVMGFPPTEAVLIHGGWDAVDMPHVNDDGSLTAALHRGFFQQLKADPPSFETVGVLIDRDRLSTMPEWPEWKTLVHYLGSMGLVPFIVFRNDPMAYRGSVVYAADIRVAFEVGYAR